MPLEHDVLNWDGKSASDIGEIYSRYRQRRDFVSKLIALVGQAHSQKGATWLLKHHLESNQTLAASEITALFDLLPTLGHWEAKLHVLQCIPHTPIGEVDKKSVDTFLRECLVDTNKFVRAWAYNGFYEMSKQYAEYREEAEALLRDALDNEAPSVKARIRNIITPGS